MKMIKPSLIDSITVPLYNKVLISTTNKKKISARAMNEKANNKLILAMQGELVFEAAEDSTTDELPDGDVRLAWEN